MKKPHCAPHRSVAETAVDSAAPLEPATLNRMLAELEAPALSVLSGDTALDATVEEIVVLDASDPAPFPRNAILLAVGVRPASSLAFDLVTDAAGAGVTAIVIKSRCEDTTRLSKFAIAAGVGLLEADDHIPWQRLSSLISTAIHCLGLPRHDALEDGGLFGLANAIAATVGGAVSIESASQQILAYSNLAGQPTDKARRDGILAREVPSLDCNPPIYRELWGTSGVVRFGGNAEVLPRVAVAVRAGSEPLGAIFVIESTPITAEAEQALIDAAGSAAPYLLRSRLEAEAARRIEADLLRAVLDGRAAPGQAAVRLNVAPTDPATIVAFEVVAPGGRAPEASIERVADLALVHLKTLSRSARCVPDGSIVFAYVPAGPDDRERLRKLTTTIVARTQTSLRVTLRAGIGSCVGGLSRAPSSRREAEHALRVVRSQPHRSVASIEDVRAQVILLELGELLEGRPELLAGPVAEIIAGNDGRGLPYAETLRAYLDCFGDIQAAAEQICVHANTFRYRLRRARELFGIDLSDPDERLVLTLQLRLHPRGSRPQ
jgi:hypothetical protein